MDLASQSVEIFDENCDKKNLKIATLKNRKFLSFLGPNFLGIYIYIYIYILYVMCIAYIFILIYIYFV